MNKGLEALKENRKLVLFNSVSDRAKYSDNADIVEKELKAIEIIKNKDCLFKGLQDLTQEEYDLLKEVLL